MYHQNLIPPLSRMEKQILPKLPCATSQIDTSKSLSKKARSLYLLAMDMVLLVSTETSQIHAEKMKGRITACFEFLRTDK